ncbi:MAG: tRNA (N(6)-L-threonylcarbamoyladenosine(37)-C(2))-methylthiotransferase MtaB [Lachnospiraceae bacterium]|nr:tRNA (N(6)-L-threonylcarbamoyladenosine(37)-C(2))-methylthiotransferase MtaB [Lachnospiraceae bacterium]
MKTAAFHNLGCKVNSYELEVMQQELEKKGCQIVPFDTEADIYIINTCTVTNIADRKSRQMLHRAKHKNPDAVVVAVGCYVQTGGERVQQDECIDLAIGNNCKKDLIPILEAYLEEREKDQNLSKQDKTLNHTSVIDINHTNEYEEMKLEQAGEHTRAYIKIQDGCNQFCSYCIIPYARGRVRSRRQEDVLSEIRGLAANGYQEVVVTGIHLSSYGMDFIGTNDGDYLEGGKDLRGTAFKRAYLISLIEEIAKIEGIERIRLGSLEPRIITDDFVSRLAAVKKVCPHFHLSLQSGCDATLKRMNRRYTAQEYYEKVEVLRRYYENPAITTDVIVGFPGETPKEFEETCAFLEKVHFFEMHIFKYSRRQGTVADRMPDQLTEKQKTERSARLLEMEAKHSGEYRASYIGKEISVLAEEKKLIDGKWWWIGHTPTYVKAAFCAEGDWENRIVTGTAAGFLTDEILIMH